MGALLQICIGFAMLQLLIKNVEGYGNGGWGFAHGTYYGGADATATNNGACGYGNQLSTGYGTSTTALSTPLFRSGTICGACFEVRCWNDPACLPGNPSIVVTATNLCPPGSLGGWCDLPRLHFDLSQPAFSRIAHVIAGHFVLQYRRVPCQRSGGIRFTINGFTYFNLILVSNVAGAGDVQSVMIKGSRTPWRRLSRNWGQNWEDKGNLNGQSLSFHLTTSDGRSVTCFNVAPSDWRFGQTFSGACQT